LLFFEFPFFSLNLRLSFSFFFFLSLFRIGTFQWVKDAQGQKLLLRSSAGKLTNTDLRLLARWTKTKPAIGSFHEAIVASILIFSKKLLSTEIAIDVCCCDRGGRRTISFRKANRREGRRYTKAYEAARAAARKAAAETANEAADRRRGRGS
jgi:hypothetical protein